MIDLLQEALNDERCWTVYIHTNKTNQKRYVGITSQDVKRRWKNGWGYYTQIIFYRAIKKYSFDGFDHEILFEGLTKNEAKQKEMHLIKKYNTTNREFGYNVTMGGDTTSPNNKWKGSHHSLESKSKISKANKGRSRIDLSDRMKNNSYKSIKVHQYDLDGNFISDFSSTREAERETGISHNQIGNCCNGKLNTAGGYVWSYDEYKKIEVKKDSKKKSVVQVHPETYKLINMFESLKDASERTKTNKNSISNAVRKISHTANGYKWMFYDDYIKINNNEREAM